MPNMRRNANRPDRLCSDRGDTPNPATNDREAAFRIGSAPTSTDSPPERAAPPGPSDDSYPRVWTVEAVRNLGLVTTVDTASSILGISRTNAYALAKGGEFPVRLVRVGRRYLVPTTALIDLLAGDQSHDRSTDAHA